MFGEIGGQGLGEDVASGIEQDDQRLGPAHGLDGRDDRLDSHDHPGPTTVGRIVD